MTVEIVVCLTGDSRGKEHFTYLDHDFGLKERRALVCAFREFVSGSPEIKLHELAMEAGWEWVVRLDALQAIELRIFDEAGVRHQIAVETDHVKRRRRIDEAIKENTSTVGFRP
jgi:hypothetical protein